MNATEPVTKSNDEQRLQSVIVSFRLITYGILLPIICTIGIIANVLSAIVFAKRINRSRKKVRAGYTGSPSLHALLLGMTISDGMLLLTSLFVFTPMDYCEIMSIENMCAFTDRVSLTIVYPLVNMAQTCSVWACVAIAIDRYVAVIKPLHSLRWSTLRNATRILLIILMFSFVYRIPTFLEYSYDDERGATMPTLRLNEVYNTIYYRIIYPTFMFALPWLLMITTNIAVYIRIRAVYAERAALTHRKPYTTKLTADQSTSSAVHRESRRTKLAMLVILTFLLFNLASALSNIFEMQLRAALGESGYTILVYLANMLVCLNSSTNFIIYCVIGEEFRYSFALLVCPCYRAEIMLYFQRGGHFNASFVTMNSIMARQARGHASDERSGSRGSNGPKRPTRPFDRLPVHTNRDVTERHLSAGLTSSISRPLVETHVDSYVPSCVPRLMNQRSHRSSASCTDHRSLLSEKGLLFVPADGIRKSASDNHLAVV